MTLADLAHATELAKSEVLWALLVAAVLVIVILTGWLVQAKDQARKAKAREAWSAQESAARAKAAEGMRARMAELEAAAAEANRHERRAKAIRLKTELRLKAQNDEIDALRKDRDWLKRIVDHVET